MTPGPMTTVPSTASPSAAIARAAINVCDAGSLPPIVTKTRKGASGVRAIRVMGAAPCNVHCQPISASPTAPRHKSARACGTGGRKERSAASRRSDPSSIVAISAPMRRKRITSARESFVLTSKIKARGAPPARRAESQAASSSSGGCVRTGKPCAAMRDWASASGAIAKTAPKPCASRSASASASMRMTWP